METCPHCKRQFAVKVHPDLLTLGFLSFVCPYCGLGFTSEQLQKIVWKQDNLSGSWYTTLVPRHTPVDGITLKPFEP